MKAITSGTVSLQAAARTRNDRGAHPAVLVHVQERPEQERRRQGDRVELVEHEEAERRIEQVGAGEEARRRAGHA